MNSVFKKLIQVSCFNIALVFLSVLLTTSAAHALDLQGLWQNSQGVLIRFEGKGTNQDPITGTFIDVPESWEEKYGFERGDTAFKEGIVTGNSFKGKVIFKFPLTEIEECDDIPELWGDFTAGFEDTPQGDIIKGKHNQFTQQDCKVERSTDEDNWEVNSINEALIDITDIGHQNPQTSINLDTPFTITAELPYDPNPNAQDIITVVLYTDKHPVPVPLILEETTATSQIFQSAQPGLILYYAQPPLESETPEENQPIPLLSGEGKKLYAIYEQEISSFKITRKKADVEKIEFISQRHSPKKGESSKIMDAGGDGIYVKVTFKDPPRNDQKKIKAQTGPIWGSTTFNVHAPHEKIKLYPTQDPKIFKTKKFSIKSQKPRNSPKIFPNTEPPSMLVSAEDPLVVKIDSSTESITAARLSLSIDPKELDWEGRKIGEIKTFIKGNPANQNDEITHTFIFQPKTGASSSYTIIVNKVTASILFEFDYTRDIFTLKAEDGTLLGEIDPGQYLVTTFAFKETTKGVFAPSQSQPLTLHIPTIIEAYLPHDPDNLVDRIYVDQRVNFTVRESPFKNTHPDEVKIIIKSSKEKLELDLKRAFSGGGGLGIYETRGNSLVAHPTGRLTIAPEILIKEKGETITVSSGTGSIQLDVSRSKMYYTIDRLRESIEMQKAMYDGLLLNASLSKRKKKEILEKSNALSRVLHLHKNADKIQPYILLKVYKAYLDLMAVPVKKWGTINTTRRFDPSFQFNGTRSGVWMHTYFTLENQKYQRAIQDAKFLAFDTNSAAILSAGLAPFKFTSDLIIGIPYIVTAPLYGGYTLWTGRSLDGQWASDTEKIFSGIAIALVIVPVSKFLRLHRTKVYMRVKKRFRNMKWVDRFWKKPKKRVGLIPRDQFSDSLRKTQIAQKKNSLSIATKAKAKHVASIKEIPTKIKAVESKIKAMESNIEQVSAKMKKAFNEKSKGRITPPQAAATFRTQLRELKVAERRFRKNADPTRQEQLHYQAFVKDKLKSMEVARKEMDTYLSNLKSKLAKKKSKKIKFEDDFKKARKLRDKHQYRIDNAKQALKYLQSPHFPKKAKYYRMQTSKQYKLQGDGGETLAFDILEKEGFKRFTEHYNPLPDSLRKLKHWGHVDKVLDIFGMETQHLAREMAEYLVGGVGRNVRAAGRKITNQALKQELIVELTHQLNRILKQQRASGAQKAAMPSILVQKGIPPISGQDLLDSATRSIRWWQKKGVPYKPTKSIGADGIFWNQKTGKLRVVEVKTGSSQLGPNQLKDAGLNKWIKHMRNPNNKLYRPSTSDALKQAFESGNLERHVIRLVDGKVVESYLIKNVGGKYVKVAIQ